MSFEQYATGVMNIEVLGEFHCGPNNESPRDFTWEVQVRYPEGALDEKGFLLDNLLFEEFFDRIRKTSLSCELLCEDCCRRLWELCNGRAEELRVTVWAIPKSVRITKIMNKEVG